MTHAHRALVLGGSGALGGAVCRLLARRGATVAFTYFRGTDQARTLETDLPGGMAMAADLRDLAAVEAVVDRAVETLGGLDVLVQCAGVAVDMECEGAESRHRLPGIDEAAYDELMTVNVKSTFFAVRRAMDALADGGGNVVFTGSMDGVKPVPSPVHYATSKGALAGMTMAMAKELGEFDVRVNMVAPGLMDGGLTRSLPDNLTSEYEKHCGLGRMAKVEEIAEVMVWLALENTYVTGQTLLVDGGV